MYIIKANGKRERFNARKVLRTCLRAGADRISANEVANRISQEVREGMTTREILQRTLSYLNAINPAVAAKYSLKDSMFKLGPAGFQFEQFLSRIFQEYGYRTKHSQIIQGACVKHEIDIVLFSKNIYSTVECKYHNSPGVYTGIKDVLYVWARFLDLRDGYKKGLCANFKEAWLASNTKFSDWTIQYAECKKMKLLGWNWPIEGGLEKLIENKKLYPITIIPNLEPDLQARFVKANIILCRDLVSYDPARLLSVAKVKTSRLKDIISLASQILNHSNY